MGALRCFPGALAYIVNKSSPNFGRLVTVDRMWAGERHPDGIPYVIGPGVHWIVSGRGLVCPVHGVPLPWHVVRDGSLRPITPPPATETTRTETNAPAGVEA